MTSRPSIAAPILAVLALVLVTVIVTALATSLYLRFESVTLLSLSPDDQWRVHLVEIAPPINIDRNFRLWLERLADGQVQEIGSERVLWSPDSQQFVLVGRHFITEGDEQMPSGELLYLLYDIPSGKLACNARQTNDERFTRSVCPWLESP